jgi:ribonuclease P/MRP protein subunit POP3
VNVQNALLAALTRILESSGIGVFHEARERRSRRSKEKRRQSATSNSSPPSGVGRIVTGHVKRKATEGGEPEAKKRKIDKHVSIPVSVAHDDTPAVSGSEDAAITILRGPPTPPEMLSKITFGVNEVTKRLEVQAAEYRQPASLSNGTPKTRKASIRFIFACAQDVDPPSMIEHLPLLVASCNASRSQPRPESDIFLVPLPKNAEGNLTEAAGLRRIAVLALDVSITDWSNL